MSTSTTKRRRKPSAAAAPEAAPTTGVAPTGEAAVLEQIAATEAEIKRLMVLATDLADKSVGNDQAEQDYHQAIADKVAAEGDLERLQSALASVRHRGEIHEAEGRAATRHGQLTQWEAISDRCLDAVDQLAAAIEMASAAYATFLTESARLQQCLPAGAALPGGLSGLSSMQPMARH